MVSFFSAIATHKIIAIRSLLLGWLIKAGWLKLGAYLFFVYVLESGGRGRRMPVLLAILTASIVVCALSAWLVARLSGPHYRPMVLLYVLVEVLTVPVLVTSGLHSGYGDVAAVVAGAPAEVSLSWVAPFAAYFAMGLANFGYPFQSIIALWLGTILMAMTMLVGGRILSAPSVPTASLA